MSSASIPLFLMLGSPMQLLVIGLIILILFGASRLGDVGKGLGEGIRNFKKGISGDDDEDAPKPNAPEQLAAKPTETEAPAPVKDDQAS
jgi:sec-independent protein translocase protein TatA